MAAPFNDPIRGSGFGSWLASSGLRAALLPLLKRRHWQMCYGGSFATRRDQIRRWPVALWQWLATQLSRGDNIAEGHYTERLWAALLAPPLSATREQAFLCAAHTYKRIGRGKGHASGCSCNATCHTPKLLGLRGPVHVSWTRAESG